jgi:hypothetical protein
MNKRFISAVVIICLTLTVSVGAVVGQNGTANTTTTDAETGTTTIQTSIQLSPTAEVTQWTYSPNGTFGVTIRAQTLTRISVVDAGTLVQQLSEADGETSATATARGYNIRSGTQTIRFTAGKVDGEAAVSLSAAGGRRFAILTSGAIRSSRAPVAYGTAQTIAVGAAVVASGGTFLWVRRKRNEKTKEVRREL